jgi:hypothetical protein
LRIIEGIFLQGLEKKMHFAPRIYIFCVLPHIIPWQAPPLQGTNLVHKIVDVLLGVHQAFYCNLPAICQFSIVNIGSPYGTYLSLKSVGVFLDV